MKKKSSIATLLMAVLVCAFVFWLFKPVDAQLRFERVEEHGQPAYGFSDTIVFRITNQSNETLWCQGKNDPCFASHITAAEKSFARFSNVEGMSELHWIKIPRGNSIKFAVPFLAEEDTVLISLAVYDWRSRAATLNSRVFSRRERDEI